MWQQFVDLLRRLFGKVVEPTTKETRDAQRYEDIRGENITATIANKLAKLTFGDSTIEVAGDGRRAELLRDTLSALWEDDLGWVTAQAYGKGGKIIVPTVCGARVDLCIADQSRMHVARMRGNRIASAAILADVIRREADNKTYFRWMDYTLDEGGGQRIRTRATDDAGREIELTAVPEWADITDEVSIGGTDRLLFAHLKCPRDNRRDMHVYGVPITFDAQGDIAELVEHMKTYAREYKLTRPMLGLDSVLWRDSRAYDVSVGGVSIDSVRRTVQDSDDPFIPVTRTSLDGSKPWDYYAPQIRFEAMEARLNTLNRRVERACGLSQGVLTDRSTVNYANRDEVRAAMYDTFCTVSDMRRNIEDALDDLAYAVDVLAERFGLTPAGARGAYELNIDWDTSLIESSEQTWTQLAELESRGALSGAELRQWVRGGTLEEAQAAIDAIPKAGGLDGLLSGLDDGR